MFKTLIRYAGGKSHALKYIYQRAPEYDTYIEPMVGGGSVFFYFKQLKPNKRYIINDIDKNLISLYRNVKNRPNEFIQETQKHIEMLNKMPGRQKHVYLDISKVSDDEMLSSVYFYLRSKTAFSGIVYGGGYSEASWQYFVNSNWQDKIKTGHLLLQSVEIYNLSYDKLLDLFLHEKNVFVFLDPPYYSNKNSKLYGKKGEVHVNFDHQKLRDYLQKHKDNFKFMITYDKSQDIIDMYKDFCNIEEYDLRYFMSSENRNIKREIIITNYRYQIDLFDQWIS